MKKRIVCFGDSNTWGYDSRTLERFNEKIRWPKLLQNLLGDKFEIIEEGLRGRTSASDDPITEGLNGLEYIHPCLMSHAPVDLVIIMLGTNDTKQRFNLTSHNIAQAIARLAQKAENIQAGHANALTKVLVVIPPPIKEGYLNSTLGPTMGVDCDLKSKDLAKHLKGFLKLQKTEYIDTQNYIEMNNIDFMHLDKDNHKKLAELIFEKLSEINII